MGLSLQKLHEIQETMRQIRLELAPLRRRLARAGSFKTRRRIQDLIDAVEEDILALERRLIDSWKD